MLIFCISYKELSWMSYRVMRFWFLLNFLFISAFFDILASLSISRVFSSGISGRWKFSGTFLSNYKYFSCKSSCLLLLLEVFKNHYRKENISVGGSEQRRDALFWIHLRETWLELFRSLWMSLSFSTFIFLIGIKLFIWHPVVPFGILTLSEQFDGFE